MNKGKVFVGLSGGVDSAVSAALLKQAGYDVTGVFIKVWQPDFLPCTWREERRDAMRVALSLKIPLVFLDLSEEYKRNVADYMIREYARGRTPNPDVLCNREIKFGAFWKKAREMGADFIATGHYTRIEKEFTISNSQFSINEQISNENPNIENSMKIANYKLKIGIDPTKDQSYFLWTLTQEDLSHIIFPVGDLEKSQVRKLAKKWHLPTAEKKDSQGICFIGDVDIEDFLSKFIPLVPGDVLNSAGEKIGRHKGAVIYTLGERHGFEITKKSPNDKPYYIISKDLGKNILVVSNEEKEIESMSPKKAVLENTNWIRKPKSKNFFAQIRYRGEELPIILSEKDEKTLVEFERPVRGLATGQSIVFYHNDECLGGGVIAGVL